MSVNSLLFLNKFFRVPQHPFNMQNDGTKSYAMWQYEKGIDTLIKTCQTIAESSFKN